MPTNMLRKARSQPKTGPGGLGIRADQNNVILVAKGTAGTTQQVIPSLAVIVTPLTAIYTVALPADHGKVFTLSAAAGFVITLPLITAAMRGQTVTFVNKTEATSNGYSLAPNAANSVGFKANNTPMLNTFGTDAVGDMITLMADGLTTWIPIAAKGIWA
jgi:hypothetical protein